MIGFRFGDLFFSVADILIFLLLVISGTIAIIKEFKRKKTLLVLDLNNVLISCKHVKEVTQENNDGVRIGNKYVWKRPYVNEFLQHCFKKYDVAIWSSVREDNLKPLLTIFKDYKFEYIWHQSYCKRVEPHPDPESSKPDVLTKPLKNIEKEHSYCNIIIVDDCIFKMEENDPKCVKIIKKWEHTDKEDTELLKLINTDF